MITRSEKNKQIREKIIKEENQKKFKFITKIIIIIFLSFLLLITYGMFIGAKIVLINEFKITNNQIPNHFHGKKIIQVSDLLYNSLNKNDLIKIKNKINELKPDIIVYTGNIKNEHILDKNDIDILENFFKNLNASLKKYAVAGQHDDESFKTIMENSNFIILNNNKDFIYYKDVTPLEMLGFNTNDLQFEESYENNNYKICLMSNPDKINEIKSHVNCNLALAGDTLGGEIKLFGIPIFDNHHYNNNYYKLNNTDFYISNGLGNTINVRYFNHPTINMFRLTIY